MPTKAQSMNTQAPFGILLIGHGTSHPQGRQAFQDLAEDLRALFSPHPLALGFLGGKGPCIREGLAGLQTRCQAVVAAPVLLNAASHARVDIPRQMAAAQELFSDLRLRTAQPIGTGPEIRKALRDRFASLHGGPVADPDTGLVVLSHGSSDPGALGAAAELTWSLGRDVAAGRADAAFWDGPTPRLETVVADQIDNGLSRIRILAHFLFEGLLMERIRDRVAALQLCFPGVEIDLAGPYGNCPELRGWLAARIRSAAAGLAPEAGVRS